LVEVLAHLTSLVEDYAAQNGI